MLKQDAPVNVTSNRLDYDGVAEATYSGNAMLWQDKSRIEGETIVLNDDTGNLTARVKVRTTMMLQDEDPKTKVRKLTETRATPIRWCMSTPSGSPPTPPPAQPRRA